MCNLPITNIEDFLDLTHYWQTELTKNSPLNSCVNPATAGWLTQNTTTHNTAVRGQLLVIIDQNPLCFFRDQPQEQQQEQQVIATNYVDQLSQADSSSPEPLLDLDLDLDDLDVTDIKNLLHIEESSTIDNEQLSNSTIGLQNTAPPPAVKTTPHNAAEFGEVYDEQEGNNYSLYSENNSGVANSNHHQQQQQQQQQPVKRSRRISNRPPGFKQTTEYFETRARNNVAVKRCREQQRRRLEETEQQLKELQHENNQLKQLVITLREENRRLTLGGPHNTDSKWSGLL